MRARNKTKHGPSSRLENTFATFQRSTEFHRVVAAEDCSSGDLLFEKYFQARADTARLEKWQEIPAYQREFKYSVALLINYKF